jgi:TatD DNase family protein
MIDTHSHIYLPEFDHDRETVVADARAAGVTSIYLPNIDALSIQPMLEVESAFPGFCHSMIGLHPTSVNAGFRVQLAIMEHWLGKRSFAAIGEVGIDLYRDRTWLNEQKEALRIQMEWAKKAGLPVVIHVREAFDEVFEVLDEVCDDRLWGVFHSFSGTEQEACRALSYSGFFLGVNGIVTFKNSGLDKVIRQVDPRRLVIETDAPYLSPVPFRGKRNQPAYLVNTLKKLADIFDLPLSRMDKITTENALSLFKKDTLL